MKDATHYAFTVNIAGVILTSKPSEISDFVKFKDAVEKYGKIVLVWFIKPKI